MDLYMALSDKINQTDITVDTPKCGVLKIISNVRLVTPRLPQGSNDKFDLDGMKTHTRFGIVDHNNQKKREMHQVS